MNEMVLIAITIQTYIFKRRQVSQTKRELQPTIPLNRSIYIDFQYPKQCHITLPFVSLLLTPSSRLASSQKSSNVPSP